MAIRLSYPPSTGGGGINEISLSINKGYQDMSDETIPTSIVSRTRFIITRNNNTEIFCGLARHYKFKPTNDLGDTAIKTYLSRNKAIAAFERSWDEYSEPKYNCLQVVESLTLKNK